MFYLKKKISVWSKEVTMLNTVATYAFFTLFALIGYFLIMELFNWHRITWLRYLNFPILGIGVFYSLRHYVRRIGSEANFFATFVTGLLISVVTASLFSIFVMIYLGALNPGFLAYLQATEPYGVYLTPFTAGFVIIGELSAFGLIVTYGLSFYFNQETTPHQG